MRSPSLSYLALLMALLGGCGASDDAVDAQASRANSCFSDADCGVAGHCYANACYAIKGDAYPIVLELVPTPSSGPSGGISFLLPPIDDIERNQPERSLTLPRLSQLSGRLAVSVDDYADCLTDTVGKPPSAHITLRRSEGLVGLPKAKYALNAEYSEGGADGGAFVFGPAELPEGRYEVYAEIAGCPLAPLLSSPAMFSTESITLDLELNGATLLEGTVRAPEGATLEGWQVDLIEPTRGRVISTATSLVSDGETARFELAYRPVERLVAESSERGIGLALGGPVEDAGSPLLRIRPPEGLIAPTALWDLAAADLSDQGQVRLDMSGMSFTPVHLTGHVEGSASDHALVTGTVVFSSLSLAAGHRGVMASYTTMVATDEKGAYAASLLPGQYRVVAIPDPALPWAITEAVWQVSDSSPHQAGRTLLVDPKPSLMGRARVSAFDSPLAGATIHAVASPTSNPNAIIDAALGKTPALPRAASDMTDDEGVASFSLDPGLYDLWVRPSDASWLPWFIQPRTLIPVQATVFRPTVVDFRIPLPILLGGRAYHPDGRPLANALVRAYALLGEKGEAPGSTTNVIQVAESHTGSDGRYKLLLPSKLTE